MQRWRVQIWLESEYTNNASKPAFGKCHHKTCLLGNENKVGFARLLRCLMLFMQQSIHRVCLCDAEGEPEDEHIAKRLRSQSGPSKLPDGTTEPDPFFDNAELDAIPEQGK